ncbi:DUF2877 domain-containing protein [Murinocardiopsis flavida]|uniref:DUF2877 domain-containing protein n=1 Tax=Murinocardiopsis flavida TaxID=645275 RepID=UPI001472F0BE|nr:DUF2877 domain-containing protein [Murinocardiopsis flavida]
MGRWWRPTRPRPTAPPHDPAASVRELGALLRGVAGGLGPGSLGLLGAAVLGPPPTAAAAAHRAAAGLVGAGPGLTPSGDDLLSGFLLAARHFGPPERLTALTAAATLRAETSTTTLSAALLRHAARGDGTPQTTGVLDALSGHGPLRPALSALRALGHTSGDDLALGILAGATAALSPPPATAPPRSTA